MDQPSVRPTRIDVDYSAKLMRANGEEQDVTVTDVSADGFSLSGHDGLLTGEQVYLKLGKGGNIQAEIRWVSGGRAGGVLFGGFEIPNR
jgi:hypothetical protein